MRTPYSSATSLADRTVSPSQCLDPRTTARQIHPLVLSSMTPVAPKTMSPHCPESPQSLQSGSPKSEGLGRTEPQSLLPTFLAADFDAVDVSARLENEFLSAAQSAELNGSRSRHLQETIDRHENCSSAEKLLPRNGSCCRLDVTEEMTQVFQEPMTPLREASSLIEENREGQDDAEDDRASNSPFSVHTPPENIIRSSLMLTPPWTPVLATPRKSAKRPSPQTFTPSAHRRGVSSHNLSMESREFCGVLPHITHADYLPPNRNPCSPYLEYADERQLLVQLRMEEEEEEEEMDGGLISTTDGMLQRADAFAILLEQTVPIASAVRTEKCRSPLFHKAGKGGGGANTFLNEVREENDITGLSPVLVEMDSAMRRNASTAVETGDVSSGNHFLDFCGFSDDGTSLGTVQNETPHRLSREAEDVACDASTRDLTDGQTSFETLSNKLLCTRVFYDLRGQVGEQTSPPSSSPCILHNTAQWDRTVGMHVSRNTIYETGLSFQPSLLSSSLSIRGDSQTFFSADNSGDIPSQLQLRNCLSVHFPVKFDFPTAGYPVSDAEDEITRGHVNSKEEEEEEEEDEEFEPGDRFCNHHRYQFLHWLHWRKAYDFVPNHLDRNGVVWLVTHRVDGLPYAVKEIPGTQQNTLQTELECLTLGNASVNALQQQAADYITRYFSVSPYSVVSCDSHESMAFMLQTEYFPMGNVMEWALDPHRLRGKEFRVPPEDFWSCVLQHGLLAMESLHAAHIIHGNPLPFNLFIYSPRHYKLGNFGSAMKFPSTYPVGSPNVFLPSNMADGGPWTPYEMDIFLFAHSMLQLWNHCIDKRKLVSNAVQTFDHDSESTLREIFLKDAMCISFSGFQEDRVKGYHEISDHLWNVLQAALRRTPISTLLRMLEAPSRLQWTLFSLFDTEEFYLLRRKRRLKRMLEERLQRKAQEKVKRQSLSSMSVNYVDDPVILLPPAEWSCRGHTAHCCSDVQIRGSVSTAAPPLPFQLPPASNPFASLGNGVALSPGRGKNESFNHRDAACNRHGRRLFNGPKRLKEDTPLSSCDTSAASYSPPLLHATTKFCLLKDKNCSFNYLPEEDMENTSMLKYAHGGRPPYIRSRVDANIPFANRDRLDANLLWTIRQIMAVMNWEDALKGIALHFDEGVPAQGFFSLSRYAVRPLTSWE